MEMMHAFERFSRPLRRRVMLMIGRAVLTVVDDTRKMQAVQVEGLSGEIVDRAERFQQYGYTSHPHPGAEALLLALGGMRQHPVVAAIDDRRHRPTGLAEGEVCLYTSEDGEGGAHRVLLKSGRKAHVLADGEIRLQCGGVSVVISSSGVTIDGNATVTGNTQLDGTATVDGKLEANDNASEVGGVTVKSHRHTAVQTGGGVSGPPQ